MAKRCIGKTLIGKRCQWDALDGSNYCDIHGPNTKSVIHVKKALKKAAKKAAKK